MRQLVMCSGIVLIFIVTCHAASGEELRLEGIVDVSQARHETGHCYIAPIEARCPPDTPYGQASLLRLFEADQELGPAHSPHADIRNNGTGCFSHWSGNRSGEPQQLYFSTSDNSDPTTNGRTYTWVVSLDTEQVRKALRLGLVHGALLGPSYEPEWYVGVELAQTFTPFTPDNPVVKLQAVDATGNNVAPEFKVALTPRQWHVLAPLSELPPRQTAIRVTILLQHLTEGVEAPMFEYALPSQSYLQLNVTGDDWEFETEGPWVDLKDSRQLRGMRYPWHISTTGEFAEVRRQVTIPADWEPPFSLSFFCSDDYLDDGWRPESSGNSVDAYPGHRFKQVLIDSQIAWEQDIADNSQPPAPTDFAVDITNSVRPGVPFTLVLRNFDKVGMDTRLDTDFYLRGIYEGDRPDGNEVLATTCWWGDVTVWQGRLTEGPAWPRPGATLVVERHQAQWPYPPAGQEVEYPATLYLEGAHEPLTQNTPVTCGVPLPQGAVQDLPELSLWSDEVQLPWQPEVMNTWPDGSVRWVMVNTVLPAGTPANASFTLRHGEGGESPAPRVPVEAAQRGPDITLRTGDLEIRCGGSAGCLIESTDWAGRSVCGRLQSQVTWRPPEH